MHDTISSPHYMGKWDEKLAITPFSDLNALIFVYGGVSVLLADSPIILRIDSASPRILNAYLFYNPS
jgi:hypothetical protein